MMQSLNEALLSAASLGKELLVRELLAKGADPNVCDDAGFSALHWIAQNNDCACCSLLLEAGADPNMVDGMGFSPLHLAAGEGNSDIVKLLIAGGADVNCQCAADGNATPLQTACVWGRTDIACALLDAGADPRMKDVDGKTPLDHAIAHGHQEIVDAIRN